MPRPYIAAANRSSAEMPRDRCVTGATCPSNGYAPSFNTYGPAGVCGAA